MDTFNHGLSIFLDFLLEQASTFLDLALEHAVCSKMMNSAFKTMNSVFIGTWNLPPGPYVLHVGVKTGGTAAVPVIEKIGEFEAPGDTDSLQLLFDESTRGSKRMRTQGSDFWELSAQLENQTKDPTFRKGRLPQHVPFFGSFWSRDEPSGGGGKSSVRYYMNTC